MNSFLNGSAWLRADFHLHTKADREFKYDGEGDRFIQDYISKLKEADIQIGVIANHNKFDLNEFKALRKAARKEEIFLLPGVELSVKDGAGGVHIVIVFANEWMSNKDNYNYIQDAISKMFSSQANYETENSRSDYDLKSTMEELNKFHKDYFFVFAHVEEKNGLWKEMSGGRIEDIGKNKLFRERTLGFQKVRTYNQPNKPCQAKIKNWLKGWYPAEVEGCDCKSLAEIGRGQKSYLKLGDFSFEAVKFALIDHEKRVSKKIHQYKHSCIESIQFKGGLLNEQTLHFSPELNTLIGIRGSGKSAIIESIRYVLDITFGEQSQDQSYKERLPSHILGSGGQISVTAKSRHGIRYRIERILEEWPDVYIDDELQPGVSIKDTIIQKPIYFGQKDLSSSGEGFEKDLVEKLTGEDLSEIRLVIDDQKQKVLGILQSIQKVQTSTEKKEEYEDKINDIKHRLRLFREYGIEKKMQKQIAFENDLLHCEKIKQVIAEYLKAITDVTKEARDEFDDLMSYESKTNQKFFIDYNVMYEKFIEDINKIQSLVTNQKKTSDELEKLFLDLDEKKEKLKGEFAEIERKLSEQLKEKGASSIQPNEYKTLTRNQSQMKQMIEALNKEGSKRKVLESGLRKELVTLNKLWHDEFQMIQDKLNEINEKDTSLKLKAEFKGDRIALVNYMQAMFHGSNIRKSTFEKIVNQYNDFHSIYKNFDSLLKEIGSNAPKFKEYFYQNISNLLIWQTPNRFIIKYQDRPLSQHSLGQRASALILFVLTQKDNDVIIIDQPEDDLDNQTLYEDVIKLVLQVKKGIQFIFATHNANFPVLGDAEQVISCRYHKDKIEVSQKSIDSSEMQNEIVRIMEGGLEAFNKRKEIYKIWKPQNSLR